MLVERGFIARHELQSILRSAIVDALLALTTPVAGGSSVSDIRFEAPGVHWAAAFVQLPLESVHREVARRAERMSRAGIAPTVPVALADLARGAAILTRDQWAIACRVNGSLTPRDLARQAGLPLYDTITALDFLLGRGLCTLATPVPPPPRRPHATARPQRADSPPARPARQNSAPARSPHERASRPVGPAPHDIPAFGGTQLPPAPRDPSTRILAATSDFAHTPSGPLAAPPSWVPADDELLSQQDTAPQTHLAAPRDVPAWDEVPRPGDTDAPGPARAGFVWGAHPAGPSGPRSPAPPGPPATRAAPAPIPPGASAPLVRRQPSFTPIVTPVPLTSPELAVPPPPAQRPAAHEPVTAGPAPTASATDVPVVRPSRRLPPAHPGYRRPPRTEWPTAAPPVPSAVLAAPAAMDSGPAPRPPGRDEPDGDWPVLPQRNPGAGLVQPPRNTTEPMSIPARDWRNPEPTEAPESEAFTSSGPDLLRRVLDGLRRLS